MHFLCTFGCILALIKMHGDFGDVSERSLVTKGSVCTLWITVPTFLLCFLTAEPIRGTSLHSCSLIGSKFKPRPYPSALMLLPLHTRQRSTTGCLCCCLFLEALHQNFLHIILRIWSAAVSVLDSGLVGLRVVMRTVEFIMLLCVMWPFCLTCFPGLIKEHN